MISPANSENAMSFLPDLSHRIARLVTVTMCVSAVWLSISCNATDHHAATQQAFDPSAKSPPSQFVPNEVLVKFKSGVSPERIASILKDNRTTVMTELQPRRLYHLRILDDRSVEATITRLTSYREIEYAEPNYRYETQK
ncbi:MAG: hypothetical protein JNL29_17595 [Nitrospira sp.]|nr:hypothetical protein [Nitrospira sp.]